MVLRHHYFTPATPGQASSDTEVTASLRLGTLAGATAEASLLAVGSCGVEVDDTFAAYDFVKHKTWYMVQDAAPAGGAIAGTVTKASGSTTVTGSGTHFTSLVAGQELTVPGGGGSDVVQVASVASDTSMTVTVAPAHSASGQVATAAPRQRVWTGYTGDQTVARGEEVHASARHWSVDLADVNSLPRFRVIQAGDGSFDSHHANRPAESAGDRLRWFLSVDFLSDTLWDDGLVAYPATALDAADYTGQYGDAVLNDIVQASRRDCFVRYHEATNHDELFLDWDHSAAGPGGRTLDAFTPGGPMRVSNVASEVDASDPATQTTFAPEWPDATLVRGGDIFAGVWGRDAKGHASYQTRVQTSYDFGWRDGVAQVPAGISTQAALDAYCASVRDDSAAETLLLRFRLLVRASQMTCLRAGERFQAHLTHLPGIDTGFRWCRAIRVTPSDAPGETQEAYWLDVEATPLPLPLTCSGAVAAAVVSAVSDRAYTGGSYSVSVTPAAPSAVLVSFLAGDQNTPGDSGMSVSGITALESHDFGHETAQLGWAIASAPATYTGTYTPGFSPADASHEAALAVALETAAVAPVQSVAGTSATLTLPAPPTAGNVIVLQIALAGGGGETPDHLLYPATGWTRLGLAWAHGTHPAGDSCTAVYARCALAGDGSDYGTSGGTALRAAAVSEWVP